MKKIARPLWLPLLLLTLSTPISAQEQRGPTFLLIEDQAESESELVDTLEATVERVGANGQLVLTEVNPITNEGALLFLLSKQEGAKDALEWSRATQIDPRISRVTLLVEAKDAKGDAVGMPVAVDINLRELYELRERPERQRNTILGAMLRNRWKTALSGHPDNDSIEARITPMLQMQAGGVAFQQPWFTKFGGTEESKSLLTRPFSESEIDDLLGRTRRPEERIKAVSEGKKLPPLRTISDRLDRRMDDALVKARTQHADNSAVWAHLNDLRSGKPRRFTDQDRAFLDLLDGKPVEQAAPEEQKTLPPEQKKGLKAGLEQLQ